MKEVKQKKSKAQKSVPDKIFVVLNTLFMIAFVVITLYPVLNTLAPGRHLSAAEKIYNEEL